MTSPDELASFIDDVPDFPKEGILFRETARLFNDKWSETITALRDLFNEDELKNVDAFVGLDARGFALAGALAAITGKGFVPVRKAGKLPPPVVREEYDLEYGSDAVEVKKGQGRVIIIDDVLATGGTLTAAANACFKAGYEITGFAVLANLTFLNQFEWKSQKCRSVLDYDEKGYVLQSPPSVKSS